MNKEKISIIIPVLNEAKTISLVLDRLKNTDNVEIIVVDGGSKDETVEIVRSGWDLRSLNVRVISATIGRANQMNAGAAIATGDILLFLHADTRLPDNFDKLVKEALQDKRIIAGAFELRIDSAMGMLRFIEKMVNWRSHVLSLPYGDQGIFLKASIFHEIGGFPDLPIMEDFELIRSLKRRGKIAIVSVPVITSGRRWEKLGVVKTTLINQLIVAGYFLGVSPGQLVRWYRRG